MTVHNCKYCKTECGFGGEDRQRDCKGYTPMTKADRIRAMSDEELAENLCDKRLTKEMWLKWLKQPVEE